MVVVAGVLDHLSAPEHLNEEFERRPGGRRLTHRELVLDLPAEPAARVAYYRDRETALAVDEADSPLLDPWPFLLIVRTGRILTLHRSTLLKRCDSEGVPPDTRSFQQIASCTRRVAAPRGSPRARPRISYLRTVIVTAAVYRGLGSELRPCGLTLPRNLPAPGRRQSVYIVLRLRTLLCF